MFTWGGTLGVSADLVQSCLHGLKETKKRKGTYWTPVVIYEKSQRGHYACTEFVLSLAQHCVRTPMQMTPQKMLLGCCGELSRMLGETHGVMPL
jgi:hypothetical protein